MVNSQRSTVNITPFGRDLTSFSSFLQGIIQINLSSTLAASVGFTSLGNLSKLNCPRLL